MVLPRPVTGGARPTASCATPDTVPTPASRRFNAGCRTRGLASCGCCCQPVTVGLWEWGRRLDQRIIAWDQRFTRRLGLAVGIQPDDALPPDERIRRALRRGRFFKRPPVVVEEDDFMSGFEAEQLLRRPHRLPPSAPFLCARGILQEAWLRTGVQGVTRSSVEAELEWRRTASRWRKFTRALGGVIHWL